MATESQIAANRANAKRSTGPTSEAGRAASAANSTKLGLTRRNFASLDYEDGQDLIDYRDRLIRELQPVGELETTLVLQIAQHHWCVQRAHLAQDTCFNPNQPAVFEGAERQLALYLRYQTTHERAFHKCHQELAKMQAARKAEPAQQILAEQRVILAQQRVQLNRHKLAAKAAPPSSPAAEQPVSNNVPSASVTMPAAA